MMLIDGNTVKRNQSISTDICIIGSGAAGLTLALELKDQPYNVIVLESGKQTFTQQADNLNQFITKGLFIDHECRSRYFGGTTNIWSGIWKPHDRIDFEKRDWVPFSGWPINRQVLNPYYQRASELLNLPDLEAFDIAKYTNKLNSFSNKLREIDEFNNPLFFQERVATNFNKYFKVNEDYQNIKIYFDSTVTNLVSTKDWQTIESIQVKTLGGNEFSISAKYVVLGCGGIENARILLTSDSEIGKGLGNQNDLVGRFYMDHPKGTFGSLKPYDKRMTLPFFWKTKIEKGKVWVGLSLSNEKQKEQKVLNSYVALTPIYKWTGKKGINAFHRCLVMLRERHFGKSFFSNLFTISKDLFYVIYYLYHLFFKINPKLVRIDFKNYMEQVPDYENRVYLSEEKDFLGVPKVAINWKINELDKYSLESLHKELSKQLKASGIGEVTKIIDKETTPWPVSKDASHPTGTTKMSNNPKEGVVDENCKVHGISNLYITGSSVFPTSGYANPTYSLVALAIRLADEIKSKLNDSSNEN